MHLQAKSLPAGDILVTNSANTPFTVISSKGTVTNTSCNSHITKSQSQEAYSTTKHESSNACASNAEVTVGANSEDTAKRHQQQQQQPMRQQQQLWKIFSDHPLSDDLINRLFINGSVIISKSWKAYPRYSLY